MPYSAKIVRSLREKRGWNQTELAYRAGVGTTVISNFENGKRQTAPMAARIAKALKVKVETLWIPEEETEAEPESNRGSPRELARR